MKTFDELYELFHNTGCPNKPIISNQELRDFIKSCEKTAKNEIDFICYPYVSYIVIGLRSDAESAKHMLDARKANKKR